MSFMRFTAPRPVLLNELKAIARSRRVHVFRMLYLAAFLLALFVLGRQITLHGGTRGIEAQLAGIGKGLFYLFVVCQSVSLGILAPALSAGIIAKEKENRTFELLLTTDLGVSEIVWHKVTSNLLALMLLLASAVPVFFTCMVFGGVAAYEVLAYLGFVTGFTLICCGTGALASAVCRTTAGSVLVTYGAVLGLLFFAPLLIGALCETAHVLDFDDVMNLACFVDVFVCYVAVIDGQIPRSVPYWAWATSMTTSVSVFAGAVALGSYLAPKSIHWGPRRLFTWIMTGLDRFYEGRWAPKIQVLRPRAPVGNNPILWRECHTSIFGRRAYFVRIGLALYVVVGAGAALFSPWDRYHNPSFAHTMFLALEYIALAALLVTCGAATIAKERQSQTLGLLLTTPLTSRAVLWGKMVGVLRRAFLVLLLIVLHVELLIYSGVLGSHVRYINLINILVFGAFFLAVGMLASVIWSSATRATLAALLISLGVVLLPVILGILLDEFTRLVDDEVLAGLSPAYWIVTSLEGRFYRHAVGHVLALMAYAVLAWTGFRICQTRIERLAAEC